MTSRPIWETMEIQAVPDVDPDLRKLLDQLVATGNRDERDTIWKMIVQYDPQITPMSDDPPWEELSNCYAYALGVAHDEEYLELARAFGSSPVVCDDTFIAVRDELMCARKAGKCEAGDIATYWNDDGISHAAVVIVPYKLCTSKHGPYQVYEHGLLEVPAHYGSLGRDYWSPPKRDDVMRLLKKWKTATP